MSDVFVKQPNDQMTKLMLVSGAVGQWGSSQIHMTWDIGHPNI